MAATRDGAPSAPPQKEVFGFYTSQGDKKMMVFQQAHYELCKNLEQDGDCEVSVYKSLDNKQHLVCRKLPLSKDLDEKAKKTLVDQSIQYAVAREKNLGLGVVYHYSTVIYIIVTANISNRPNKEVYVESRFLGKGRNGSATLFESLESDNKRVIKIRPFSKNKSSDEQIQNAQKEADNHKKIYGSGHYYLSPCSKFAFISMQYFPGVCYQDFKFSSFLEYLKVHIAILLEIDRFHVHYHMVHRDPHQYNIIINGSILSEMIRVFLADLEHAETIGKLSVGFSNIINNAPETKIEPDKAGKLIEKPVMPTEDIHVLGKVFQRKQKEICAESKSNIFTLFGNANDRLKTLYEKMSAPDAKERQPIPDAIKLMKELETSCETEAAKTPQPPGK